MSVLTDYVDAALKQAVCEKLEDGQFFCSIASIRGPYASASSKREALEELRSIFEEWLVAALRDDDDLPVLAGLSLNFAGKRWPDPSRAATSSPSFVP